MKRLIILVFISNLFAQGGVFLPYQGENVLGISTLWESSDKFWRGDQERSLPNGKLKAQFHNLNYSFGIKNNQAIDIKTGYVDSEMNNQNSRGLSDTEIGWSKKLGKGDPFLDYIHSVRAAIIFRGSYQKQLANAAGDGGSGFNLSYNVGRQDIEKGYYHQFSLNTTVKNNRIPPEVGLSYQITKSVFNEIHIGLSLDYQSSIYGIDIGEAGYSFPKDFSRVKEESFSMNFGVSLPIFKQSFQFNYGRVLKGRNTAKSDSLSIYTSFYF